MEETLSTLDYAIRAKSIRNRPEVNAHLTKSGVLKEYLGDIERLKAEVMAAREKNGIYVPEESWREMHEAQTKLKSEYDEAKLRANAATVELETKRKEFDLLSERFLLTTQERDEAREAERELGVLIEATKAELDIVKDRLEEEVVVSKAFEKGEQKLAGVASGLKGVAVESVKDVGGLFEKIGKSPDAGHRSTMYSPWSMTDQYRSQGQGPWWKCRYGACVRKRHAHPVERRPSGSGQAWSGARQIRR